MNRLKFGDASFLYAETSNAPMNIASVQLLEVPEERRASFFDDLMAHLSARVTRVPFLTSKLLNAPFGLDHPIWVTDSDFDIHRHVQRVTLASPGTPKQLEKLIGRLHEEPLNRKHPLWKYYLIEGLEDGNCAWYTKYHHACLDGVSAQQIVDILFSEEPAGEPTMEPPPSPVQRTPSVGEQLFSAMFNASVEPWLNLSRMAQTLSVSQRINATLRDPESGGAYVQQAPATPFNVSVSSYRNVAFGSLPLGRLRAVGKARGASINDVFMAVCAGGLRGYLQRKDLLPQAPLIAGVPVSLRRPDDTGMDNRVSMLLCSLATDIEDPLARLDAVRQSAQAGKSVVAQLAELPSADPHVPGMPVVAATLAQFAEDLGLADMARTPVNVVISNVPGPRKEKYLCGARMLTHYPVSIAANGTALNLTVQSYLDRMDFSATACLEAVPDADVLIECILDAWRELESAVVAIPSCSGEGDGQMSSVAKLIAA